MATLYMITNDLIQLMEMLEDDPESQIVADTLEGLKGELEIKSEGYCQVIKEYELVTESLSNEIKRLTDRKSMLNNNIERLKKALFTAMKETDTKRINGNLFTLSIRNNAVSLDNIPDVLPEKYLIAQESKIDRRMLLGDIKSGIKVDGVTLKTSQSLTIK